MNRNIYIAGPMRGYPLYNFAAFMLAATALRKTGNIVHSPAEIDMAKGFNPAEPLDSENNAKVFDINGALREDFRIITNGEVDTIVLLPGWRESSGASAEAVVAYYSGVMLFEVTHLEGKECMLEQLSAAPVVKFETSEPEYTGV